MRDAETVTFGGSGLDRAAHLRDDPVALAALAGKAEVLPVWRGRPLMAEGARLGWLPAGHPVLAGAGEPVFLGLDGGRPRLAADISGWAPEGPEDMGSAPLFLAGDQPHPALEGDIVFGDLRLAMVRLSTREAELAAMAKALLQWHATHGFCATCGAASRMAQGGWRRDCPACGAQHFPRTDPVVIMLVTRGNRTLLGRSPGWPEGMYSCLAGFIEPGETVEAAVRREVAEETGIRLGAVRYLASQPWPFPASLMIGCAAEALDEAIRLDPVELEDALWLTREELVEAFAGLHPAVKPPRAGAIAHFMLSNWLADRLD